MSDHPEVADADVVRLYHTVLYCHRHPGGHRALDDYTERSLATFHRLLAERGLPKEPDDDTTPDPFAGYSTIQINGRPLREVLPAEGMKAILDYAFLVRTGKASIDGVGEVLRPFFPNVEDPSILGRQIIQGIENYHVESESDLRQQVNCPRPQ